MIYILNNELSNKKVTPIALKKIFGLGIKKTNQICVTLGISKKTPIEKLSSDLKNHIISYIEKNITIGDKLKQNLILLKEEQIKLKTYKGQRAKFKLPRRGQRTRTNAKTAKKL